jgi:hypothetical protein
MRTISQEEFETELKMKLEPFRGKVHSVIGPGRSGAIASVFASYYLGIPWLPQRHHSIKKILAPVLIVDTAEKTGKNLRRCRNFIFPPSLRSDCITISIFKEPPNVRFWFEMKGKK